MEIGLEVCFSVSLIWRKLPLLYWIFCPFLNMLQLALHLFKFSKCLLIVAFVAVSIRTNGICLVSQSQKRSLWKVHSREETLVLGGTAAFSPIVLGWGSLQRCSFACVAHKPLEVCEKSIFCVFLGKPTWIKTRHLFETLCVFPHTPLIPFATYVQSLGFVVVCVFLVFFVLRGYVHATMHVERPGDNFGELVLFSYHMGLKDSTPVFRLDGRCPLSHLVSPSHVCITYLPTVSVSQSVWSLAGSWRLSVSTENMSRWRRKASSW